jgi:hypothetical protein
VRSAEPPIISGATAQIASSVFSEALRVAISGFSATAFSFSASIAAPSPFGSLPCRRRSNSAFFGELSTRSFHAVRVAALREPSLRQRSRMSAGISNGP